MLRFIGVLVLSASCAAAFAQAKPATGDFSGAFTQEGGSATSDVKLHIKHITPDGRVTARITDMKHANKACNKDLPASGIVLKDGSMRLEVDAGAPDGCERIYNVKSASGSSASGTFVEATRTGGKLFPRGEKKK